MANNNVSDLTKTMPFLYVNTNVNSTHWQCYACMHACAQLR